MTRTSSPNNEHWILERQHLPQLFSVLQQKGYQLVGPTIRDGVIIYDTITAVEDLPAGWTDKQEKAFYRLSHREDGKLFSYTVGPHSWKKFLHPPLLKLWQANREHRKFQIIDAPDEIPRYAFIGVRACELHAIAIQDKIFMDGQFTDSIYKQRRENAFVIAVNCDHANATCFCASMNTGPKATMGFDLALTEVTQGNRHYFVVEVGTTQGEEALRQTEAQPATEVDMKTAASISARTEEEMGRHLDTGDLKELLHHNTEHPHWDDVAARCLACANCTMVCPTCFCTTVEDVTDLTGDHAERWRKWDSCFTMDFSYIHGGSVRASTRARYRQWLTHKLSSWHDQFGTSGCVGCGRCIAWCPVGIDLTEEVKALRNGHRAASSKPNNENR